MLTTALFSAAGCGATRANPGALTDADNGKTATVNVGETLVIELGGNPSTGYTWEVKDLDIQIFQQVGDIGFRPASSTPMVGQGGTQILTLKALKSGTTPLTLVYHRPWETGVAPLETYTVTVTVK
jgi:inhibitor of cysteine peptidase